MRRPKAKPLANLVKDLGGRFSTELGIKLDAMEPAEIFKWLLGAILYGARISERSAARTYAEFVNEGLVTPERIVCCGWDGLVEVLDSGGYVRYDFKTATKLLEVCRTLLDRYGGDLNALHKQAHSQEELQTMLRELGKGLGPVTIGIFLRELRGVWSQARAAAVGVGPCRSKGPWTVAACSRIQRTSPRGFAGELAKGRWTIIAIPGLRGGSLETRTYDTEGRAQGSCVPDEQPHSVNRHVASITNNLSSA